MPDIKTIYLIVALVCVVMVYLVQEIYGRRKRRIEADLNRVRQVARDLMPTTENYVTAYARTVDPSGQEGRCAISFKPVEAYVIPIRYVDGEMEHGEMMFFEPDELGKVEVEEGKVAFYDLVGNFLLSVEVLAEYQRQLPQEPFQIKQKKETNAFLDFLKDLEEETNIVPV